MQRHLVGLGLLLVLALAAAARVNEWPHRRAMSQEEQHFRKLLNIPSEATRVLVLSQSSHLDWDWTQTNQGYFVDAVNQVLKDATAFMANNHNQSTPYLYSCAETGFLQDFWEANPALLPILQSVGLNFHMVGGGITSPDNIVCNGETLIRNYLYGLKLLKQNGINRFSNTWIPDDFGHDPQFPVAMSALGMTGTSFSRVPGASNQGGSNRNPIDGSPSVNAQLLKTGVDFWWEASDGSTTFAHYMQDHYCQGDNIDQGTAGSCNSYLSGTNVQLVNSKIAGYINLNGPNSPTPYIFVPIGCDFQRPKQCLLQFAQGWDQSNYLTGDYKGIYVVAATFDDYYNLVTSYAKTHPSSVKTHKMDAFPYWTGFYLSRPGNKIKQENGIRLLQAAEFLTFVDPSGNTAPAYRMLDQAWAAITPSTHHDYITGTAVDDTYNGEQIGLLEEAEVLGARVRDFAVGHIIEWLRYPTSNGETGVAVFNSLGFARNSSTLVFSANIANVNSFTVDGSNFYPLQQIAANTFATVVPTVPSFGWTVGKVSTSAPTVSSSLSLKTPAPGQYTLSNAHLSATISKTANWGVTSLIDLATGQELLGAGGAGNLIFYNDDGNIYRFGNEMQNCGWNIEQSIQISAQPVAPGGVVNGPAFVSLTTTITVQLQSGSFQYVRTYSLGAQDKALKVETTGASPAFYSIFTRVAWKSPVSALQYGTPLHWDSALPVQYWQGLNFMSIHHFLRASNGSSVLGHIYTAAMRAWAIDTDGSLLGGLFRNSPGGGCEGYGADGTDTGIHTMTYFLRVPSGTKDASTGEPMRESMAASTPVFAGVGVPNGSPFANQYSLASVVDPSSSAFLTVAKACEDNNQSLVLRIYNPTNKPVTVGVKTVQRTSSRTAVVTALEDRPDTRPGVSVSVGNGANGSNLQVSTAFALTTVLVQ